MNLKNYVSAIITALLWSFVFLYALENWTWQRATGFAFFCLVACLMLINGNIEDLKEKKDD